MDVRHINPRLEHTVRWFGAALLCFPSVTLIQQVADAVKGPLHTHKYTVIESESELRRKESASVKRRAKPGPAFQPTTRAMMTTTLVSNLFLVTIFGLLTAAPFKTAVAIDPRGAGDGAARGLADEVSLDYWRFVFAVVNKHRSSIFVIVLSCLPSAGPRLRPQMSAFFLDSCRLLSR